MPLARPPELAFQEHIAAFLVREHKYGVLEQGDITDTENFIVEDHLWAFLNDTQSETVKKLAEDYGTDARDEVFRALYQAWLRYQVLLFPPQELPPAQQVAFARQFGEVIDILPALAAEADPLVPLHGLPRHGAGGSDANLVEQGEFSCHGAGPHLRESRFAPGSGARENRQNRP